MYKKRRVYMGSADSVLSDLASLKTESLFEEKLVFGHYENFTLRR